MKINLENSPKLEVLANESLSESVRDTYAASNDDVDVINGMEAWLVLLTF